MKEMTVFPLSVAQQGLWFLSQVDAAASAAYNMVFAFETTAALDEEILRRSLEMMAQRHEILRSSINSVGGIPHLQVAEADAVIPVPIRIAVLSVQDAALRESGVPIDLSVQPLYRVVIIDAASNSGSKGGLVCTFPHLVFDEASAIVFFDELARVYSDFARGRVPQFDSSPVGFQSIVQRERDFIASSQGRMAIERAIDRLRGVPNRLALPRYQSAMEGTPVHRAAMREFFLPHEEVSVVGEISKRVRATPAAVYLATFQLLLWRYSGQNDFGVSIPVTNRSGHGIERCLGYLTNLGIVRSRVDAEQSVTDFIASVTDQLLDVLDACEVPFPVVAKQLKRSGEDLQGPLLQIGFNYIKSNPRSWRFGESELQSVEVLPRYAKHEFKLDILESADGARCWFLYDQDGFDPRLIERMVGHYRVLLAAAVTNPQAKLKDLPLLTETERHQLVVEWNDTKADFPSDKCIHQLFEEQVEKNPDAVAVIFEDQQLTYGELNARANQLAHHLRSLGVKPDTLVAICAERSLEMVVGLLGILKAGGAYVPLDPDYPRDRLGYMLQDTAAPVLVTQENLKDKLPQHTARTVCLDADWAAIAQHSATNPATVTLPLHLAYCMFTSGSTGKPKAISTPHRSVNRLVKNANYARLTETETYLQAAPLAFDASTLELWGSLLNGAQLIVMQAGKFSFEALARTIEQNRVSILWMTAALFEHFCKDHLPSLQGVGQLLAGGDVLSPVTVRNVIERFPNCRLINGYGPTESTTFAACYTFPAKFKGFNAPIGRPISNTQIYILNGEQNPVPVGVAGEIHIAGVGLARGYLNRPDMTAEKFIPNPFGEPGSRMYKTGDLGRYLPDGNIEFLGRIDLQVKIRGFRIEPGEIESTLLRCEEVRDAVVLAREDVPGDKRLVAYVVPKESGCIAVDDLRALLQMSLPEYMMPASWVFLGALPLDPNGKIDRKALPAPEATRADLDVEYVAPRTPTEELLASIWAEVLKVDRVGIHDNFFALGGHSLLATQMISRLKEQGRVDVPLRALFNFPTVSALAQHAEGIMVRRPSDDDSSMETIRRQQRRASTHGK